MESVKRQRQPEQQPANVGGCVSAPPPVEKIEEARQQDEYNGMNGVCCK